MYSEVFGNNGCDFGRGDEDGEYYIAFSYDDAEEYVLSNISKSASVRVSYTTGNSIGITESFVIRVVSSEVRMTSEFTMNNKDTSTYQSTEFSLEKKNWTVAFKMVFPEIASDHTVDIFTTTGRDCSQGFTFSIKRETGGIWSARIKINGTTYWHKGISYENFVGKETAVAVEIEWLSDSTVRANVYYNGVENISASAYPKSTENTLDYATTSVSGHTPVAQLTFGSFNPTLNTADSTGVNNATMNQVKDYNVVIDDVMIYRGLHGEDISRAMNE